MTEPNEEFAQNLKQGLEDFQKAWEESGKKVNATMARENHLSRVRNELRRQDEKWGEQNHPDIGGADPEDTLEGYAIMTQQYRAINDRDVAAGILGWDTILLEEVFEALEESDPDKLKEELVQAAAVCLAWVASIERRK